MRINISVIKIKQALLELCKTSDPSKITVQDVLERSGVSRATFYKYFPNLHHLWHTISHDLVRSMALQHETLDLTSDIGKTSVSKEQIGRISAQSSVEIADRHSCFLFKNRACILFLIRKDGDPMFVKKWIWLNTSILSKRLELSGYTPDESERMGKLLSLGMIKGCMDGITLSDQKLIFEPIMTTLDVINALCENKTNLEYLRKICN